MITMKKLKSHEEWLEMRKNSIGGSDASSILGLNPWKSNVKLWLEKKGIEEAEDISNKAIVKFGIDAEKSIRELFALDHKEFKVQYLENNLWVNDKYTFAHASLDGWLSYKDDEDNIKGILEIKTTNKEWADDIPDYYYAQLLHYLMVTEFDFAILKARMKKLDEDIIVKHYMIRRKDVENDIKLLAEKEKAFYESLKGDKVPNLILPDI